MKDRYFEFEQVNGATLNNALDKIDELTAKLYKAKEALKCIDEDLVNPVHYILVKEALQELDK